MRLTTGPGSKEGFPGIVEAVVGRPPWIRVTRVRAETVRQWHFRGLKGEMRDEGDWLIDVGRALYWAVTGERTLRHSMPRISQIPDGKRQNLLSCASGRVCLALNWRYDPARLCKLSDGEPTNHPHPWNRARKCEGRATLRPGDMFPGFPITNPDELTQVPIQNKFRNVRVLVTIQSNLLPHKEWAIGNRLDRHRGKPSIRERAQMRNVAPNPEKGRPWNRNSCNVPTARSPKHWSAFASSISGSGIARYAGTRTSLRNIGEDVQWSWLSGKCKTANRNG